VSSVREATRLDLVDPRSTHTAWARSRPDPRGGRRLADPFEHETSPVKQVKYLLSLRW
jgi:hypothetical protein